MLFLNRRIILLFVTSILMFVLFAEVCLADNPSGFLRDNLEEPPAGLGSASTYSYNIVYVIIVLLIIIGLIIILIKFLAKKNKTWMANRAVRLLGGINLGQNKSVQIIEMGHTIYLIGIGQEVQLLDKIHDAEEVAYILKTVNSDDQSFKLSEKLQSFPLPKWVNNMINPVRSEEEETRGDTELSFQDVFQNKIKHLTNRKKRVEEIVDDETKEDRYDDKL